MKTIKLKSICDTWNMVDKFNLRVIESNDCVIVVPMEDFNRMLAEAKTKRYIKNLVFNKNSF